MYRVVCAGVFLVALVTAAAAQKTEPHNISVEFNDLQEATDGCRAVFVLHNGLAEAIDQMTLRIVAFDADAHATLFLSLDVGPLPVNKTRVVRFDLGQDVACKDVSRLVLDDVTDCAGGDLDAGKCLNAVAVSSRAGVPFDF